VTILLLGLAVVWGLVLLVPAIRARGNEPDRLSRPPEALLPPDPAPAPIRSERLCKVMGYFGLIDDEEYGGGRGGGFGGGFGGGGIGGGGSGGGGGSC
jgi:uncharacterized membrane protein YgcG